MSIPGRSELGINDEGQNRLPHRLLGLLETGSTRATVRAGQWQNLLVDNLILGSGQVARISQQLPPLGRGRGGLIQALKLKQYLDSVNHLRL